MHASDSNEERYAQPSSLRADMKVFTDGVCRNVRIIYDLISLIRSRVRVARASVGRCFNKVTAYHGAHADP
jgi:hypothetical protein